MENKKFKIILRAYFLIFIILLGISPLVNSSQLAELNSSSKCKGFWKCFFEENFNKVDFNQKKKISEIEDTIFLTEEEKILEEDFSPTMISTPIGPQGACLTYIYETQWGGYGTSYSQFGEIPSGIDTDSFGNVYVTDDSNGMIKKFDSNGNYLLSFSSSAKDLEIDSQGNIFAVTPFLNKLEKFNSNGSLINYWNISILGNLDKIALDYFGNIYILDYSEGKIFKFNQNMSLIDQGGGFGTENHQFENSPLDIATDIYGNVYVSEYEKQIKKFSSNLSHIFSFGNSSYGIALDGYGNIYATSPSKRLISKYDFNGNLVDSWDTYGVSTWQFENGSLRSIVVDSLGKVYFPTVYELPGNNYPPFKYVIQKFSPQPCVECFSGSLIGDANGDGSINSGDAHLIAKVFVDLTPRPSNICCIDSNGDGAINSIDSLLVMKYFVGYPDTGLVGQFCS